MVIILIDGDYLWAPMIGPNGVDTISTNYSFNYPLYADDSGFVRFTVAAMTPYEGIHAAHRHMN